MVDEDELNDIIDALLTSKEDQWVEGDDPSWVLRGIQEIIINGRIELSKVLITYGVIDSYINSIKDSIEFYYNILNPDKNSCTKGINRWLESINRMGLDEIKYMPLFLALFNRSTDENNEQMKIEILELMENHIFVKKYAKTRISSQVRQEFYTYPYELCLYSDITEFKTKLKKLILDKNEYNNDFDAKQFIEQIKSLFEKNKNEKYGKGFYDWSGLSYLLYEYELHLQAKSNGVEKVLWSNVNKESIEHVLPQTAKGKWLDVFKSLKNESERNQLIHSIGNLVLMAKSKNSKLSNKQFSDKKEELANGSYSEIAISKNSGWDSKRIEERGVDILRFMKDHWRLDMTEEQISKLAETLK